MEYIYNLFPDFSLNVEYDDGDGDIRLPIQKMDLSPNNYGLCSSSFSIVSQW